MAWGGRRYSNTAQLSPAQVDTWLKEAERMICLRLSIVPTMPNPDESD